MDSSDLVSEKNRITCSEVMYYICFAILFGYRALGGDDGAPYYKLSILIAVCFFGFKVIMTEHTVAELLLIGVLFFCACLTYALTGEKSLIIDYALMLGVKGIPEKRIFRFGAWILGLSMGITTFLITVAGVMENRTLLNAGRHPWMPDRYCLAYPHTNTLLTTYIILMMLVMYGFVNNAQNKQEAVIRNGSQGAYTTRVLRYSLVLALAAFYFWLWCDSKTGVVITLLYLVMNLYYLFLARFGRMDRIFIYGLYPLINIVSIAGSMLYPLFTDSSGLLHSLMERFRLTYYYLNAFPLSLFGVRIIVPEGELYAIDVSQIRLLLNLGLVAFVTVSFLYYILLRDCVREKRRGELPIILSLMIMGISDPLLYNLSCKNLTFFFMGAALYRWMEEKQKKRGTGKGLQIILAKKVQIIPAGDHVLVLLSCVLNRTGVWIHDTFMKKTTKSRLVVSMITGIVAAVLYHVCTAQYVEPIRGNLMGGHYLHALHALSFGVYGLLISYGLLCIGGRIFCHRTENSAERDRKG